MKKLMRVISMAICFIICANMLFINTSAYNKEVVNSKECSFETNNALGNVLNNITNGNGNNDNYSIAKVELENNIAKTSFTCSSSCKLIVAIYEETSGKLFGTGITTVSANASSVDVTIDIVNFPQFFLIKAFLVDDNNSALCKPYINKEYTRAFKSFFEKEPEDFIGENVLVFDDSKENEDFAVLSNNVKVLSDNSKMTFSTDATYNKFYFDNANENVKNLSVGDIFYWNYGVDDEYLLLKVKSIENKGSIVIIEQDEDVSLEELFSFVRIDDDSDFTNYKISQKNMGEAMTLIEKENKISVKELINKDDSSVISTEFKIEYPKSDEEDSSLFGAKVTGSGKLSVTTHVKLFYDVILFGKDYYEFETTVEISVGISVKASGSMDFTPFLTLKALPSIPIGTTGITVKIEPAIVFKVTASIELSGSLGYKLTITADTDNDLKKNQNSSFEPNMKLEDKIELKIGIQIKIKIEWVKTLSVSVTGEGGAKLPLKPTSVGAWLDKFHDCILCLDGEIDLYVSVSGEIKFKIMKVIDIKWEILKLEWSWKKCDFYFSINPDGVDYGAGDCKRILHKVSIKVFEKNNGENKAIQGATITCSTCKCDSNGDGKYTENSIKTSKDGEATIYCKPGTHSIIASTNGYSPLTNTVNVLENPKNVTFIFGDSSENPPIDPPNIDGEITWTFNSSNNTLTISGNGSMSNYSATNKAPWYNSYNDKIEKVVIENGVKNIGNYAFYCCKKIKSCSIPNSVTKIGTTAFYECNLLNSITIPDSVKSIGSYAFYDCYNISSILTNGVESIGDYAFTLCSGMITATFSSTLNSIGNSAFKECAKLNTITIKNKNCSIYDSANTIPSKTVIVAPSGSLAKSYATKYNRTFKTLVTTTVFSTGVKSDEIVSFSFSQCKSSEDYIVLNVTNYGQNFELSSNNLEFIDQIQSDEKGEITYSFIPKQYYPNSTTLLIGDFGNGNESKTIRTFISSNSIKSVSVPDIDIRYKDSGKIIPTIDADSGASYTVKYSSSNENVATVDQNGNVYGAKRGEATITCKVTDENGNTVSDTCKVTVSYAWWQWLIKILLFGWIWY